MHMPVVDPKIKVSLYYWPHANMGLGHVACVVEEVTSGGSGRTMYITPGFASTSQAVTSQSVGGVEAYLRQEMRLFDSPSVIKIALPVRAMSYDEFLETFKKREYAGSLIDEGYSVASRSCAHLANQVLCTVYGIESRKTRFGLLPSRVAQDACLLLDKESSQLGSHESIGRLRQLSDKGPTSDAVDTHGTIARISKYQFAQATINVMLSSMDWELISVGNLPLYRKFHEAKNQFEKNLKEDPLTGKLAQSFKQLQGAIKEAEDTLQGECKKEFGAFKLFFYKLILIFSQNPKLRALQDFKKEAAKLSRLAKKSGVSVDKDEEKTSPNGPP